MKRSFFKVARTCVNFFKTKSVANMVCKWSDNQDSACMVKEKNRSLRAGAKSNKQNS